MLHLYLNNLKLPDEVEWAAIREVREESYSLTARNGRSDKLSTRINHGYMVEVLVNGQFAYASTNTLTYAAVEEAANKAVKLAKHASLYKIHNFSLKSRPKAVGHYRSSFCTDLKAFSKKDLIEILIAGTKALKVSDKIVNTLANAMIFERDSYMVSSNGTDLHQETLSVAFGLLATAGQGQETQTRTNGMPCFQMGLDFFEKEKIEQDSKRIGEEALELLEAEECPTGLFDLVLSPDQLYLQVHESIGHPLELDRILGDEKNYAGWSFVKSSDFGRLVYGPPILNVTFDPGVSHEFASYAFDDIGNTATREYLIKEGVLVRGLGSLESQERLNLPGVANMRSSSWNRPPIDRMANINIEPGDTSFEKMIEGVEDGILMQTNRSWSIDDYRNKFQFGCEYAKRIKNGRLTQTLKNPNYRGTTIPFWNKLKAVGDSSSYLLWGSPYCGKGEPNQCIHVGHATPVCHFEKVEVFGGAS